ncbi:AraC family transcriptional regulator [Nocardia sp. NPDC052001]|uniref:AraC family transcriptional regulator n=1 Tax=Nocardia sp. NPDC052001 TaxID=3154853 RepID=UPI003420B10F
MTDPWAKVRAVTSATLLTDFAVEYGASTTQLLRGTGIRTTVLHDPTAEITAGQELALLRNLVEELGDRPGLGLAAGARYHASSHGVWGFAILSSPDVRSALEVGIGFAELSFSFARITLDHDGPHPAITFDDRVVPAAVRRFHMERDLQATLTIQRELIPTALPVRRIEIPFPADPAYDELLTYSSGITAVFDAPRPLLSFDASALDMPLPQANRTIAAMYEGQCAELVNRRRERLGISGRVRDALVRRGGLAGQPEVAADLNLSIRTLRRRLSEEGATFRELSEETFGLLAEELLDAGLTVEQTAERLGYSSASSFTHAFKAWRGQPPGRYSRTRRTSGGAN